MPRCQFRGSVAVVTGAGSGIGRQLAVQLAGRGARGLALCDVDPSGLGTTEALCHAACPSLRMTPKPGPPRLQLQLGIVDVSDEEAVGRWRDEVLAAFGGEVNFVFCNAGIGASGRLVFSGDAPATELASYRRQWHKCFDVDFYGVLYTTTAFLPTVIAQRHGGIINVASLNALWTWPEHTAYTAAKAAVKGLTESLMIEVNVKAPHVHIGCVFPGGVKTGIVANAEFPADVPGEKKKKIEEVFAAEMDLTPAAAAGWILAGCARGQTRIVVGYDAMIIDWLTRLCPTMMYSVWRALGHALPTRVSSMQDLDGVSLGVTGAAKTFLGGGWWYILVAAPLGLCKLRHTSRGRVALHVMAIGAAVLAARYLTMAAALAAVQLCVNLAVLAAAVVWWTAE